MPCVTFRLPDGGYAIAKVAARRRRPCSVCGKLGADNRLCDFPVSTGKTCDRVLCAACTAHREPDVDYCPEHAARVCPDGRLKL
jgi:hypothetical protein